MTKLDSLLKSRHYFAIKGPSSKSYGFSSSHVWMWELGYKESGPKNRCFWIVRVPRTARRSNQSILKEISPKYSLEGLMLKLNLQYFGHLMQRTDSFEKTLKLGKIEGGRKRGQQRMRWLDGITKSMDISIGWTGWISLQSKGLSRVSSNTTVQKHQFFGAQLSL